MDHSQSISISILFLDIEISREKYLRDHIRCFLNIFDERT